MKDLLCYGIMKVKVNNEISQLAPWRTAERAATKKGHF